MVRAAPRIVPAEETAPVIQTLPVVQEIESETRSRNGRQPRGRQMSVADTSEPAPSQRPARNEIAESHVASELDDASRRTEPDPVLEMLDPIAPRMGAEIDSIEERDGVTYYTIRDLRNGIVTANVTRESARRLWQYAINEREKHPVDEGHIRWKGDYGFWKVYRPSRGERRYNLAYRGGGQLRIFYGVGDDGLDDRWRAVLPAPRVATE
jgi:hypothetical protein